MFLLRAVLTLLLRNDALGKHAHVVGRVLGLSALRDPLEFGSLRCWFKVSVTAHNSSQAGHYSWAHPFILLITLFGCLLNVLLQLIFYIFFDVSQWKREDSHIKKVASRYSRGGEALFLPGTI